MGEEVRVKSGRVRSEKGEKGEEVGVRSGRDEEWEG